MGKVLAYLLAPSCGPSGCAGVESEGEACRSYRVRQAEEWLVNNRRV